MNTNQLYLKLSIASLISLILQDTLQAATLKELIDRFRHQESVVQSCEAEFDVLYKPTRPEMFKVIDQVIKENNLDVNRYIYTEEICRNLEYTDQWWREGIKERVETVYLNNQQRRRIQVFDGLVVRSYDTEGLEGKPSGDIGTMDSAHWKDNRIHPYSMIYTHYEVPFSEVLSKSVSHQISSRTIAGEKYTELFILREVIMGAKFSLKFLIDKKGFVKRRELYVQDKKDRVIFPREVYEFSDYQSHPNPKGEPIFFPSKAVYTYSMGKTLAGELAEYSVVTINIKSIRFNTDIPASKFTLELPSDIPVWDRLSGLGLLEPGNRPEKLFPEESLKRQRYWTIAIVVLAVILVIGSVLYVRKRRVLPSTS